jgi:hypothetical protein
VLNGGEWRAPDLDQITRVAQDVGLEPKALRSIMEQVTAAVRRWPHFAEEAKVPAKEIERVQRVLTTQRDSFALRNVIATAPSRAIRPQASPRPRPSRGISPG